MNITVHENDLPHNLTFQNSIAVDTETMGLNIYRDRLCVVQLCDGSETVHIVKLTPEGNYQCPNLKKLLANPKITKLFHYARFDISTLKYYLNIDCTPVYCTKIASKLVRTYTDRHGLKELCRELLDIEISKQQQSSDWGAAELSEQQLEYAAYDVYYLHRLQEKLDMMLKREQREHLAAKCFDFLPNLCEIDLLGWDRMNIFSHS